MKTTHTQNLFAATLVCTLAVLAVPARIAAQDTNIRNLDAASEEEWAYSVGIQNYVFGLPLTIFERERKVRLDPVALEKAGKVCSRRTHQSTWPHEGTGHRR